METTRRTKSADTLEVVFPHGNRAVLANQANSTDVATLLSDLGIDSPAALIMVIGGADSLDRSVRSQLQPLFSRGIARAAQNAGALILDGGTQSGVMALTGEAVARQRTRTPLLGVAPAGKVTWPGREAPDGNDNLVALDPNHTHFVLADSHEWGGETDLMFAIADALASDRPAAVILVGGGPIAKVETLYSVQRGWPVIVIEGSGGVADELVSVLRDPKGSTHDAALKEIAAEGSLHPIHIESPSSSMETLINRQLGGVLRLAWETFALYDKNATGHQKRFFKMQAWILALGVVGTILVLTQASTSMSSVADRLFGVSVTNRDIIDDALHYLIVLVPITTSALLAASIRFNAGNRWVLLRSSAEALKREIFRFRCRTGNYSDENTHRESREEKLARKVQGISRQLMQTDVNVSALRTYSGPIPPRMDEDVKDDGLSDLSPGRYIAIRLGSQLKYYRSRTERHSRELNRFQMLILIAGALGTFLAAVGLELWIALTTALAFAFAAYLEHRQTEMTLIKYNQSAADLNSMQTWWAALTPEQQSDHKNVDKLVEHTERILATEHVGWVQEMRDMLASLYADQAKSTDHESNALESFGRNDALEHSTAQLVVETPLPAQDGSNDA